MSRSFKPMTRFMSWTSFKTSQRSHVADMADTFGQTEPVCPRDLIAGIFAVIYISEGKNRPFTGKPVLKVIRKEAMKALLQDYIGPLRDSFSGGLFFGLSAPYLCISLLLFRGFPLVSSFFSFINNGLRSFHESSSVFEMNSSTSPGSFSSRKSMNSVVAPRPALMAMPRSLRSAKYLPP